MNQLTIKSLMAVLFLGIVSFSTPEKKDALKIFQELDLNSKPNTLAKKEKKQGWKLLFDGKTTKGWRGYNMAEFPDCWEVNNGSFIMTTTGGAESQDIITTKKYKSFAFSIEFKLTKGANSGIIFQVEEDAKYKFPYETGPEYQVMDHENWVSDLEDWQICGANYAMYPSKKKPFKALGEWNHAVLIVDGNHLTQILNGEVVVTYEKYSDEWKNLRDSGKWSNFPDYGKFDKGHISLQNHGTNVSYRNVKLKEL